MDLRLKPHIRWQTLVLDLNSNDQNRQFLPTVEWTLSFCYRCEPGMGKLDLMRKPKPPPSPKVSWEFVAVIPFRNWVWSTWQSEVLSTQDWSLSLSLCVRDTWTTLKKIDQNFFLFHNFPYKQFNCYERKTNLRGKNVHIAVLYVQESEEFLSVANIHD
jgi:hypothetical protein